MTSKPCSWVINVTEGKLATVALEVLYDTSQRFMVFVVDGAFTTSQVMMMKLKDLAPLVLATTFSVNMMNMLQFPNLLHINCSDARWSGGKYWVIFVLLMLMRFDRSSPDMRSFCCFIK